MNTVEGTVSSVHFGAPLDEGGRVRLVVAYTECLLLTKDVDTDVCFDGEKLRGSDVLAALADAAGPVSALLWPRDDGTAVKAKFTTGG